jgi:hypothetical protein
LGPGSGGWEFSALLITCLLVTAWEDRNRLRGRAGNDR